VSVPGRNRHKAGPFTLDEFRHVKSPPAAGADIVARLEGLCPGAEWGRHTDEHGDGSGYPGGRVGEAIPLAGADKPYGRVFNDGFYDLIHVTLPKGSLLHPDFPAALGSRTHALSRQFDVLGGALSYNAPEMATAAGYGSSPHFLYSGVDKSGRPFQLMEILYGGIPGRPIGDGMDGHSWWPLFQNIPSEYLETYYPMLVEGYSTIMDTGGAGKHRGGNGVEKIYLLLEEGDVSIHDDRHQSQPWGILGGRPGACSEKWLVRKDGTRQPLPSKVDNVRVRAGDRVLFRTAGGGGWGDPLEHDIKRTRHDGARRLRSETKAREE